MPSTVSDVQITPSGLLGPGGEFAFEGEANATNVHHYTAEGVIRFESEAVDSNFWTAEGIFAFESRGRYHIDDEPDVDLVAEGQFQFVGEARATHTSQSFAEGVFAFEGEANATILAPETDELDLIIDVGTDSRADGNYIKYRPRFVVDGEEFPWISGKYSEPESLIGGELDIRLARLEDALAITEDSVVEFGFAKLSAGVWDEATYRPLIVDGRMTRKNKSLGWASNGPTDQASFNFVNGTNLDLILTALTDVVIYNSTIQTIDPNSFIKIYDRSGNLYPVRLVGKPNLSLHSLLRQIFVTECGFDDFETDLPDNPVGRVDIRLGQSFYDAIKPVIGSYEPILSVRGTTVWLQDGTVLKENGFPAPKEVPIENWSTAGRASSRGRDEGMLLSMIHNIEDLTYQTTRLDDPIFEVSGNVADGSYSITSIIRTWREYRKQAEPFVIVGQDLSIEDRETKDVDGFIISTSHEVFNYNAANRIESRVKKIYSLVPDLDPWNIAMDSAEAAFRAAYLISHPDATESEIQAAVNDALKNIVPSYSMQDTFTEVESYEFLPYPFESNRDFLYKRDLVQRGLITLDDIQRQLGKPFRQAYQIGIRSGNLKRHITLVYGTIKTHRETAEPLIKGEVSVNIFEKDHIQNVVNYDRSQHRIGDVTNKTFTTNQYKLLLFDDTHTPTDHFDAVEDLSFGPVPIDQIVPLAQRKLFKRKHKTAEITVEVIGYDESLLPGTDFTAMERGVALGDAKIRSREVTFDKDKIMTSLGCTEI
jgi:hypothetical protein